MGISVEARSYVKLPKTGVGQILSYKQLVLLQE